MVAYQLLFYDSECGKRILLLALCKNLKCSISVVKFSHDDYRVILWFVLKIAKALNSPFTIKPEQPHPYEAFQVILCQKNIS